MTLESLEACGLGVTSDEISRAFEPFVQRRVTGDDSEWRAHLRRRRRRIVVKGLRRALTGWLPGGGRDSDEIQREYSRAWGEADYDRYSITVPPERYSPWEWRGELMLANTIGATRFRHILLARLVERHRPRRVLEVGCGDGINLLLLASRFPDVSFTGVELTQAGHERATALQDLERLPQNLIEFAPEGIVDASAHRRIDFRRGNAAELPFADGSFDLVFTVLALEQMERIRSQALSEISRVVADRACMIEPFRDVNAAGWRRLNVLRRDYFRAPIASLSDFGLEPVLATEDVPQEVFLGAALVVSEKR